MRLNDVRGLPVSTGDPAALASYELAARQTLGYFGNPLATLDEALAEDPDFAMAHALRADLAVMSSEQGALPLIRDVFPAASCAIVGTPFARCSLVQRSSAPVRPRYQD